MRLLIDDVLSSRTAHTRLHLLHIIRQFSERQDDKRTETSLNGKIQDPVKSLYKGAGVLELNSFHKKCLFKK